MCNSLFHTWTLSLAQRAALTIFVLNRSLPATTLPEVRKCTFSWKAIHITLGNMLLIPPMMYAHMVSCVPFTWVWTALATYGLVTEETADQSTVATACIGLILLYFVGSRETSAQAVPA